MRGLLFFLALCPFTGCFDPGRQILHPAEEIVATPADHGIVFEEVRMARPGGGETRGWWLPNAASDAAVLICGGNSGNRSHYLSYGLIAWRAGFSVLMVDYRGFGPDNGNIDAKTLGDDGQAAFDWLRPRARRVGVWGISLGSAVAAGVSARRSGQVDALVLEGSFRIGPALRQYLGFVMGDVLAAPLSLLARALVLERGIEPADTLARRGAGCPVLFVHGDRDRLTRTLWAAQLFDGVPGPKEMWIMKDTGHAPEPLRAQDGEYQLQVTRFLRRALLGESDPQAGAAWTAARTPGGWTTRVSVSCTGPFPAPVEAVLVCEDGVLRRRLWLDRPETTLEFPSVSRPVAATARRYQRVLRDGPRWTQDLTPTAAAYRTLRHSEAEISAGRFPAPALLAADFPSNLAAHAARVCYLAASLDPDPAHCRDLLFKCWTLLPDDPRHDWILGDATYHRGSLLTRQTVFTHLEVLFSIHSWDRAPLDALQAELATPSPEK